SHRRRFGKAVVRNLMNYRRREARGIGALARWSKVSDHLDELAIGAPSRGHVQLVTHKLAFIFHAALIGSVHHAPGERESIRSTGALDNLVIKLSDPNRSGYAGAFLMEIQVGSAKGAVGQGVANRPIPRQF